MVERRGDRFLSYVNGRLVGEIAVYPKVKWSFFHYGYGGWGGTGAVKKAVDAFWAELDKLGWTGTIKGGNPLLESKREEKDLRTFKIPNLDEFKGVILDWIANKYPTAEVEEIAIYGGMGWFLATGGRDSLGIRDMDINIFFKAGGPRNLAWTTHLTYRMDGVNRTVDLFWNTLPVGVNWKAYAEDKAKKAKSGRWLTIPDRPWVSLLTGKVIWKGKMS